jgi:outer membrane protein assembly factor BamB
MKSRTIVFLNLILAICSTDRCYSQTEEKKDEPADVTPSSDAKAKATSGWTLGCFDTEGTSFNPYEKRISASNVGRLKLAWSNQTSSIRSFVSVVGETAYYGDYGGAFHAVEAATGKTVWKKSLHGKHQGHAIVGGVAYVTSIHRLYAFSAASGEELWTKAAPTGKFSSPLG